MTKRERFVRRLYPAFARNLGLYLPEWDGSFACPFCLTVFSDLDSDWPRLSNAHIVPKLLKAPKQPGVSVSTLACERCNKEIGGLIETEEAIRIDENKRYLGVDGAGFRARTVLVSDDRRSQPLNLLVRHMPPGAHEGRLDLLLDIQKNNPASLNHAADLIRQGFETGSRIEFRMDVEPKYDRRRANLTYLSVAYLRLFHEIGYEWLTTPAAKAIRTQLVAPHATLAEPCHYHVTEPGPKDLAFSVVRHPAEFRGFLVGVPPVPPDARSSVVWVPAPQSPYPAVAPTELENSKLDVEGWPSTHFSLTDPGSKFWWHRYFDGM